MSGMEDKDLEDRINILVMETSANKYIKIVEENNMHFPDYEDICVQNAKKELFSFVRKTSKIHKSNDVLNQMNFRINL